MDNFYILFALHITDHVEAGLKGSGNESFFDKALTARSQLRLEEIMGQTFTKDKCFGQIEEFQVQDGTLEKP